MFNTVISWISIGRWQILFAILAYFTVSKASSSFEIMVSCFLFIIYAHVVFVLEACSLMAFEILLEFAKKHKYTLSHLNVSTEVLDEEIKIKKRELEECQRENSIKVLLATFALVGVLTGSVVKLASELFPQWFHH